MNTETNKDTSLNLDEDCNHEELECGICNDCGIEVDWVGRVFRTSAEEMER